MATAPITRKPGARRPYFLQWWRTETSQARSARSILAKARVPGSDTLYLSGPRFRHRIEAIVERFTEMQDDLNRERRAMTKMWARREEQIRGAIESTAGMFGDLQGIAGQSIQEIEGLDLLMLDGPRAAAE